MKQQIKKLKKQIDAMRPLSRSELAELKKWHNVTYTYHSNAIEGNTLTLAETKIIVEDGLTVGGHPVREILEAKNHKEVIEQLMDIVKKKQNLTEDLLFKLHKTLIKSIDDEGAGVYREIQVYPAPFGQNINKNIVTKSNSSTKLSKRCGVYITGEEKLPPSANKVPKLMKEFFIWYEKNKKLDSIDLAAKVHYRFVKIHPFIDGNGRIARILSNLILMSAGYPLVIIPIVRRIDYINSLKATSSERKFIDFFAEMVLENMKDYIRMTGKNL